MHVILLCGPRKEIFGVLFFVKDLTENQENTGFFIEINLCGFPLPDG